MGNQSRPQDRERRRAAQECEREGDQADRSNGVSASISLWIDGWEEGQKWRGEEVERWISGEREGEYDG